MSAVEVIIPTALSLLSITSTIGYFWLCIISTNHQNNHIYQTISLCLLISHYTSSLFLYYKQYNIHQHYILFLISLPIISPIFPCIHSTKYQQLEYSNPDAQLSKLLIRRLRLKYKCGGFIIHCLSQILPHCILLILKINVESNYNRNELFVVGIYLLYLALAILPLFHSVNIRLLIFNWYCWFMDFISFSLVLYYLFDSYQSNKGNITYLTLYIIGMCQYSVYLFGFLYTLYGEMLSITFRIPIHIILYKSLIFNIILIFSHFYLGFAELCDIEIVRYFGYELSCPQHNDFWNDIAQFLHEQNKINHLKKAICCIIHILCEQSNKVESNNYKLNQQCLTYFNDAKLSHLKKVQHSSDTDLFMFRFWEEAVERWNKFVVIIIGGLHLIIRMFVIMAPYYVLIKWLMMMNENGIDVVCCVIIVVYMLCVVVWIIGFIDVYPIYYGLYYIFTALPHGGFAVHRYSDIEDIRDYMNQIIHREWTEKYLMETFGNDIGFLLNEYVGTAYLSEIANDAEQNVKQYSHAIWNWEKFPWYKDNFKRLLC